MIAPTAAANPRIESDDEMLEVEVDQHTAERRPSRAHWRLASRYQIASAAWSRSRAAPLA
jgi:hypothetical protein